MSERSWSRVAARTLTGVVLVVSGGYLMVYLYRWEWNRALISGVFFLAAEIVVVTIVLSSRMSRLERRIDDGQRARSVVVPAPNPAPNPAPEVAVDVDRESPFAWLDPTDGRMGVFVPLLMGAGVVLSAVAFVIEKLAAAAAKIGSPPRAARTPALGVPAGGFLAAAEPASPLHPRAPRRRGPTAVTWVMLATGLVAFPLLGLVADLTQTRPDPHPDRVTVEAEVRVRDARESAVEEATALAVACQHNLRLAAEVEASGPGQARLVVTGVIGDSALRRFTGCLQDATLERVWATVVRVSTSPASSEVTIRR